MDLNARLPRIDASRFSMVPRSDIPRSTFITTHSHKTTFDPSWLIPIHVDEVLPGDVHHGEVTIFARMATPIFPVMDSIYLETFFFFVPCRLVWNNWQKFMGERTNPSDSISYTIPYVNCTVGGSAERSLFDYMGIPVIGQVAAGQQVQPNALPFRAYNLIWNEWFRDQNLQSSLTVQKGDGPDTNNEYGVQLRNKKHDYFTSALPWPLKGGQEVALPLGTSAPIMGLAMDQASVTTAGNPPASLQPNGVIPSTWSNYFEISNASADKLYIRSVNASPAGQPDIYADLSQATGATINALRMAVQTQRLLERDARSGTRYTELLRAHFGVMPQDMRLQRPEYIGGGKTMLQTQAIPQTSQTSGGTVLGQLGATALFTDRHSFSYTATEHGYILGLANVNAELTYQQGLHRMWTRRTRYDFYWPVFAHLGEQAIRNDEIYSTGNDAQDSAVFGYQERWAEYRHRPSRISGNFRSTTIGNIDEWHVAEQFSALPALNSSFITDKTRIVMERVNAAGAAANGMQVLFDSVFRIKTTRPMPMFSVPGMMDRF